MVWGSPSLYHQLESLSRQLDKVLTLFAFHLSGTIVLYCMMSTVLKVTVGFCGGSLVQSPPMLEAQVQSLVREDPTRRGATKPVHHDYRAGTVEPGHHNY